MLDVTAPWQLVAAALTGMLLGGFYFGGLWWTVHRLPATPRPWRLYFTSLLVRMAAVAATCWAWLTCGNWQHLVVCLAGWWLVRFWLIHYGALTCISSPTTRISK